MRTKNGINIHGAGYVPPERYEALNPRTCQLCGRRAGPLWSRDRSDRPDNERGDWLSVS